MKLTAALKNFLSATFGVAADADDATFLGVIAMKSASGELKPEKLKELMAAGNSIADIVKDAVDTAVAKAVGGTKATDRMFGDVNPVSVISKSAGSVGDVRVIEAGERYEKTRKSVVCPTHTKRGSLHPNAGRPATFAGRSLDTISQYGKAVAGAYFKWCLSVSMGGQNHNVPRGLRMTDHDRQLVKEYLHTGPWTGVIVGTGTDEHPQFKVDGRKLTEFEIKTLLDDSTSGGIEIAPIEFDDAIVTTPVLFGELMPRVNVVNVSRGRRMKGGAVSNPTFGSTAEGTAITAFDTTSYVSAFDTTIFPAVGAMKIGMDFEEDSPTNIGQIIVDKYGEKAMEWCDRVIACGNGTTEPQGIVNATGIGSVLAENGTGGSPTVSDYEGLLFSVGKAFRNTKGSSNVFIGNETSYRRARGIPVGPTDERRVFGMTHSDYMLLDHPYAIQGSLTNSQIAFANLGYYRMYRRLGMTVRVETAGQTLALENARLIVVRMRFGGKLELGGAAALIENAQA